MKFDINHYINSEIDTPTDVDLLRVDEYLYRAKWISEFIRDGSILDLGCNNGILSLKYAYQGRRVVGIDLSKEAINFCNDFLKRNNISQYYQIKIEDYNGKEKFNNIFVCEVIEHAENPKKILDIAKKQLKKNGLIFLTTPDYYGQYGINNTGDTEHLRTYKAFELKKLILKYGTIIDFQKKQLLYCAYKL